MNHLFLNTLKQRVLLCDGGHGTLFQTFSFDPKKDFLGHENCFEILNLSRPDLVSQICQAYLEAGADCVETNTFGANKVVLADHDLSDKAYEINLNAAQIARKMADQFSSKQQPRFVAGSMGPGSKLPTLGHITYDELVDSYAEQARGLLDGGIDFFLLETHQDLLTMKAAIEGCRLAKHERSDDITPIFAQVTMESNGTLLTGSDIGCVVTTLAAMNVDSIGLNCSTGPAEMADHIKYLSENWPKMISVMPNAGLPLMVNGQVEYHLTPDELAACQLKFIEKNGVNLIGGCCGTTPEHIRALRYMLDQRKDSRPIQKNCTIKPAVSSLFHSIPIEQENSIFLIGERANANGCKKFREYLCAEDWDNMDAIVKEQIKNGAHAVDICTAYVDRNESQDLTHFLSEIRINTEAAFVVDSTNPDVIERGLKLLPGKSIINSINFESGEEKAQEIISKAKQFGTAIIGLTIDENGMAKTTEDKIKIAKRLYNLAVIQNHIPGSDLLIDPLTFTICTGDQESREHGINTLNAIEQIKNELPKCQIVLGLSNISYGLDRYARKVLNSVFFYHAQKRGMNAAIIHVANILPIHQLSKPLFDAAENLIFNDWKNNQDPLLTFLKLFENIQDQETVIKKQLSIEEALEQHIIDGDKLNLESDIKEALKKYEPLQIINQFLLKGMEKVGELFSCGKTQLPFVLQSAEVMKKAVTYLEQFIDKQNIKQKGTIVLATVQGDVHDIGKNLVEIILSNNGYRVINLGIKQSLESILGAAKEYNADAIGLSGLLVQSTMTMKTYLEKMHAMDLHIPVILGGAALTSHFVNTACADAYGSSNQVLYAKDAFSGLKLMDLVCG